MSRSSSLLLALSVAAAPVLALAPRPQAVALPAAPAARDAVSVSSLREEGARLAGILLHPDGAVRTLRGSLAPAQPEASPEDVARTFLRRHAGAVGITAGREALHLQQVRRSPLGTTVRLQRVVDGLPLSPGVVVVHLDAAGAVTYATSEAGRVPLPDRVEPSLTEGDAAAVAVDHLQAGDSLAAPVITRRALRLLGDRAEPVTEVTVPARQPLGDWLVVVDDGGRVVSVEDRMWYAHATVFEPNAVVRAMDPGLVDADDAADAVPPEAYSQVELLGLDDSGYLTGEFVSTENTSGRVQAEDGEFHFDRSQAGFEEAMIYFHIDFAQRYFQSLGFDDVNNRVQKVDAHGTSQDNSWYRPSTKNLTFGDGGVDDAEDAEIIFHEYGHSTQDNQVPGWGSGGHARAMGEAFGDYLGGAISQRFSDFQVKCVGDWDGVSYSNEDPPCLRRLDGTKHFPEDLQGSVHADGEIWSAALWQVHEGMGGDHGAMRIVLAHHFLLAPGATMPEAAEALLEADTQLNGGANHELIRQVMVARGILQETGYLTVKLADEAGAPVGGVAFLEGTEEAVLEVSEETGTGSIALDAGEYVLSVRAFGYLPTEERSLVLADGEELVESYALTKAPTGTLAGVVTTQGGAPLAAHVRLLQTPLDGVDAGSDGTFSITAPVGSYDVEVRAFGYRTVVLEDVAIPGESLAVSMEEVPPVLLVDDDSTASGTNHEYEVYFQAALEASGHGEYDVVKAYELSTAGALMPYETVVWFTGKRMSDLMSDFQRDLVEAYLAEGGRIVFSGQDLGYGLRSSQWLGEVLGVVYVKDSSEDRTVSGGDLSLELGGDSANNQSYPDVIDAGGDSTLWLHYGDGGGAGLIHDEGEGRVVYLGFGLEGVDGAANRAALMGACFDASAAGADAGARRALAAEWFRR